MTPSSLYTGVVTGLPTCEGLPSFPIFQGDIATVELKVAPSLIVNDPMDITDATEIVVNLLKSDGTILQLKLSTGGVVAIVEGILGKFSVLISVINSALLNVGEFQTFDVTFTIDSVVTTIPFIGALSVFQVS